MDRQSTYRTFWSDFIKKVNKTPALIQAHGSISQIGSHSDHYLEFRRNGILFRYNIYWQRYTSAYITVGYTQQQIEANCQEVPETTGQLKTMNPEHWPDIHQKMIQAMLDLISKLAIRI